jgi:glycosyltransferase involved in cell wall biosynthesis
MTPETHEQASRDSERPYGVLFLDNSYDLGGLERKLIDFFRAVDRSRFRPVAAALKGGGELAPEIRATGMDLHERLLRFKYDPAPVLRLLRLFRSERIRLVYTFAHPNALFYAYVLRKLLGGPPVIVSIHATGRWGKRGLLGPRQRFLLRAADRILAVASMHRELLIREEGLPAGKIEVIYNGVDLSTYRPGRNREETRARLGVPENTPLLVIVARLVPLKGHPVLLEALEIAAQRGVPFRALLVGDGPERAALEERARSLGLEARVAFTGARHDVPDLLGASDLAALVSHQEALPNALIEAHASGLPVVATSVGSVPEIVVEGETGHLVPPGNAGALADRLAELLADPGRRRLMGRNARRRAETVFPLEKMFRERERVFTEVIEGRSPRS